MQVPGSNVATVARGGDALLVSTQVGGLRRWGGAFIVRGLQKLGFPVVFKICQMMQLEGRDGKSSSRGNLSRSLK